MPRIRFTYANVIATIALFAALGGSSYAAIAVTGAQVRDGSLTGRDVRNSSITGKDVRDQSLLAKDFKAGQLPAGPQGPKGDPGSQGPKGDKGDAGPSGLAGYEVVKSDGPLTSNNEQTRIVNCPAGKIVIGGGAALAGNFKGRAALAVSQQSGNGWMAQAQELAPTEEAWFISVSAICVNAG